jgi:hypothetical protein
MILRRLLDDRSIGGRLSVGLIARCLGGGEGIGIAGIGQHLPNLGTLKSVLRGDRRHHLEARASGLTHHSKSIRHHHSFSC